MTNMLLKHGGFIQIVNTEYKYSERESRRMINNVAIT